MKKIATILTIVIITLLLLGVVCDNYYKKFWQPVFNKLDVAIKDTTHFDGIYIGDSRVQYGINPYYIDSIAGTKSYNIGMMGASINESEFLLRQYFKQHNKAPKFVLISCGFDNFYEPEYFFKSPCPYLFYINNKETNTTLQNLGFHTGLYKILPITKYTAFDDFNKFCIINSIKGKTMLQKESVVYNGFIGSNNNISNSLISNVNIDSIHNKRITQLQNIFMLCKQKNATPIFVFPPMINKQRTIIENNIINLMAQVANKNNISILNFSSNEIFSTSYFSDNLHLNNSGSAIYSKKLGEEILKIIKQ